MKRILQHPALKLCALIVVFSVLVFGYMYFREQSLLSHGKARAETVMQDLTSGDPTTIEDQLYAINKVDKEQAANLPGLQRALRNIAYIGSVLADGKKAEFVDDEISKISGETIYTAIYKIPDQLAGEDFVLIVCRRETDQNGQDIWSLSDVGLSATNPLAESTKD